MPARFGLITVGIRSATHVNRFFKKKAGPVQLENLNRGQSNSGECSPSTKINLLTKKHFWLNGGGWFFSLSGWTTKLPTTTSDYSFDILILRFMQKSSNMHFLSIHVPNFRQCVLVVGGVLLSTLAAYCEAPAQTTTPPPQPPQLTPASDEGQEAIAQFKFPDGLVCELFAAEPDVANIVAFHRDFQGRVFVCETYRQSRGVEDNRNHGRWMDEELAAQTVEDRINYIKKYIPDAETKYTEQDDRIRLLVDQDGDGKADRSTVFSDRYNAIEMGTGAGVLSYRDQVYYTCIPDLFLINDTNGDGVADQRKSLSTGFGVRFAFRGHDMHGLIVGPDGRLYFSIGDRGYNVSPEVKDPASGAVFRCELDGSNLEVVATGLRNPQELAFDDFGNLFTGDNNSDSGDKARFTEIVRGGDSGWRMYYQYIPDRGPFNREKIWYPYNETTPAYIIPPIANISDGPSGLEFYPGTGFGERFADRFFLCDFRGNATVSGVRSFRHQAKGAGWELVDKDEQPFWNMLITDIDFGSDGKLYVADWVFGWQGENKGRIYSFFDPSHIESDLVKEVESVLRSGMKEMPVASIVGFLGHRDRRVRQEAQFELARRSDWNSLRDVATSPNSSQLARVHAIWGLEQIARAQRELGSKMTDFAKTLVNEEDPQVVIAATKLIETLQPKSASDVVKLLTHENTRVRFQAAMTLNVIGGSEDAEAIGNLLQSNADADPVLRHAAIMGLVGIFERDSNPATSTVAKLAKHDAPAVRRGVCVAMRKVFESNRPNTLRPKTAAATIVAGMLQDDDISIVLEAARVIHDLPINAQMGELAKLITSIDRFADSDPLVRRILNANFRVGTKAGAESLVEYAVDQTGDKDRRIDAIQWLSLWANPPERDNVLHDWRPLSVNRRNVLDARMALESNFERLLQSDDDVATAAITCAGELRLTSISTGLADLLKSTSANESARVAALQSLDRLNSPDIEAIVTELADETKAKLPPELKATLIEIAGKRMPAEFVLGLMDEVLSSGTVTQKQSVISTLGSMKDNGSEGLLLGYLDKMMRDDFDDAVRLDVVLASEKRKSNAMKEKLSAYRQMLAARSSLTAQYNDALLGGDPRAGRRVFNGKTEVSCVRCHKVGNQGGEVGPNLSGIGLTRDREYLLEAIVEPNKKIAEGFAQTKVLTIDGLLIVGLVKKETDEKMILLNAEGEEVEVLIDDIEDTLPGASSMPEELHLKLSPKELRDLIAFLAEQKKTPEEIELEHK